MCGLAGMIDPRLARDDGVTLLGGMLDSIRHRGPDASSQWIDMPVLLGHNRLSIIDLTESAGQPMHYDGLVVVHNGEIYNYLELRAELSGKGYRFRSQSDTEVLAAAYREWGAKCVQRFIGMWAFAIWDTARRELFCSRDRFGIKPFYYIHSGDRFYFGSEYKPLKQSPLFDGRLNLDHIRRSQQVGAIAYRDETCYACLTALPERCNLLFKDGTVTVTPYWDIDTAATWRGTFDDKVQRFAELFRDSVRLQMRSDVPVGGLLSGGLDSSSIASVVGTDFPDVPYRTFTIYYGGWRKMDERPWADQVVSAFANIRPTVFTPSDDDVAEGYEAAARALDTPMPASVPLSCYFVMRAASRAGIKVVLDGQGADEYLAGYDQATDRHIAGYLRKLQFMRALAALGAFRRERGAAAATVLRVGATGVLAALAGEQALHLRHFRPSVPELLWDGVPVSLPSVAGSRMNQYAYNLIFGWFLPSLLLYGDRMSMAWSVECRVPFLDHRLVEFAFSLDETDRIREGRTKYVLRRSLAGTLPSAIVERRDKQKFLGGEADQWLRGPLRHLIDRPLDLDGLGFMSCRKAARIVEAFKRGNRALAPRVWSLASLHFWLTHQ